MVNQKMEQTEEQTTEPKKPNKARQAWNWIWHSDSALSWVVALVLAFIVVKFIFFPALTFLLGTQLPLVVVESSSMEHPGSFVGNVIGAENNFEVWWREKGEWYEQNGIDKEDTTSWELRTGFDKGDIMIVYGRFQPEVGDVIIFEANTKHPIIHRIISINGNTIQTKGDNNDGQLPIEKTINKNDLVGKAVFRIPKLGWIKLVFVEIIDAFKK